MYKTTTPSGCIARVCVRRNQVKIFSPSTTAVTEINQSNGSIVYLQDGQEFEIELYNPTQKVVAAKIILNGTAQQHSIVLKPGQRSYIERYPDEPKKFKFDTYIVDDSPETQAAIAKNGLLRVEFYEEYIAPIMNTLTRSGIGGSGLGQEYKSLASFICSTSGKARLSNSRVDTQASMDSLDMFASQNVQSLRSMETGRIEKGNRSNQRFSDYSGSFNSYYSFVSEYKLVPLSQKPLEVKDLAEYCTECGTKNKKGWKFCPSCGNKF